MRYHSSLIKHYISIADTPTGIANNLILKTCEVEEIIQRVLPEDVVIGKVLSVRKHPQADKLVVCELDCGEKGLYTICTGGENIVEGAYVPVALPGCYLPVIDLQIEPRKMRGEDSNGMICSKGELGIQEDEEHHRIWILQYDKNTSQGSMAQEADFDDITEADKGIALKAKYPRLESYVFDVDNKTVTHRPDLTGHFGLARELNAIYGITDKNNITLSRLPSLIKDHTFTTADQIVAHGNHHDIPVKVVDNAANVYSTIYIKNITPQRSSLLTRSILLDCDSTPRLNWIDISNYFMLLTGQPIHCFDADTIEGGITVRYAKDGEIFTDLKDVTHTLQSTDIVIADNKKILALGGVIGGKESGVTENTKNVLVEIAHFDPVTVRKTGTRLALRTDAELRFEKNINPAFTTHAIQMFLDFLAYMQKDLGTYELVGLSHTNPSNAGNTQKVIDVDWQKISTQIVGDTSLSQETAEIILTNLGFVCSEDKTQVIVPRWRGPSDINGNHDIVEEVARIYGYDTIPFKQLLGAITTPVHENEVYTQQLLEKTLVDKLQMTQVETYPWLHEKHIELFSVSLDRLYTLQNPRAPELKHMRNSLLYGLLEMVSKNTKSYDDISLFDTGKVWTAQEGKNPREEFHVGILSYKATLGSWDESTWFVVKHALQTLLQDFRISLDNLHFEHTSTAYFHSKKQAKIFLGDVCIGEIGALHPYILEQSKIDPTSDVTYGYLYLEALYPYMNKKIVTTYETSQDQIIWRDLSFVTDKTQSWEALLEAIKTIPEIADIKLFDIYAGDKLPEGKKSIALSCKIKGDGSLTTEAINAIMDKAIAAGENTGAKLR